MNLPEPVCRFGYPMSQLSELLGPRYAQFQEWIHSQTVTLCDGQPPCLEAHGHVAFEGDVQRFNRCT